MVYTSELRQEVLDNTDYRRVVSTTSTMQLVMMSLKPGEDIELEKHSNTTQFIYVEQGFAEVQIGKKAPNFELVGTGCAIIIRPNVWHRVICPIESETNLKMFTLYSPPEHPPGKVQQHSKTKK